MMADDIAAHIAEVREKLWPWKPLNPRYAARGLWEVQDANGFERHLMVFGGQEKAEAIVDALLALPQTLDLLEAEHKRAERLASALNDIRGSVDTTQDAWEIATAALEAQEEHRE